MGYEMQMNSMNQNPYIEFSALNSQSSHQLKVPHDQEHQPSHQRDTTRLSSVNSQQSLDSLHRYNSNQSMQVANKQNAKASRPVMTNAKVTNSQVDKLFNDCV